ncbi:MAG: VOC family protein [Planctomycetota bacterium]|jgi:uncharacterized glyoxalase superfamily protein PhnB
MATSLDTVIVATVRMEELAAWYAAVLELGEWERLPGHLGQRVGEVYFGFDAVDEVSDGDPSGFVAWFHVDDVFQTFDRAVEAGAEVLEPPKEKPFGYTLACVRDPDGNRVGLAQKRGTVA